LIIYGKNGSFGILHAILMRFSLHRIDLFAKRFRKISQLDDSAHPYPEFPSRTDMLSRIGIYHTNDSIYDHLDYALHFKGHWSVLTSSINF